MTTALGFILMIGGFIKFSWNTRFPGIHDTNDIDHRSNEEVSKNGQRIMIGFGMMLAGLAILGFKILSWIFGSM